MARNKTEQQAALAENMNSTDTEGQTEPVVNEHATTGVDEPKAAPKSIVPAKYAGKYKNGGSDALAQFIKSVCGEGDKFEFSAFFALCRANIQGTLTEDQIAKYEEQVSSKAQGANGRARMTLRNMLATIVRKEGKLKDLAGNEHELTLPKPAVSGAAAKAQETAATNAGESETAPEATQDGTEAGSDQTE